MDARFYSIFSYAGHDISEVFECNIFLQNNNLIAAEGHGIYFLEEINHEP